MKHKFFYALMRRERNEADESGQLSFDFAASDEGWFGPMFWPTNETDPEKIVEEYYNSLKKNPFDAKVIGHYEKEGDEWRLIPLK
jgi:hypothetical protein